MWHFPIRVRNTFNFRTSFLAKKHKNSSVKPPQRTFHGVKEHTLLFLPGPEAQSIKLQLFCFSRTVQSTPQHSPNDTQSPTLTLERKPGHTMPVCAEIHRNAAGNVSPIALWSILSSCEAQVPLEMDGVPRSSTSWAVLLIQLFP